MIRRPVTDRRFLDIVGIVALGGSLVMVAAPFAVWLGGAL